MHESLPMSTAAWPRCMLSFGLMLPDHFPHALGAAGWPAKDMKRAPRVSLSMLRVSCLLALSQGLLQVGFRGPPL